MFAFADPRQRRRSSLTPMIDVVFLLLIFFMLAARLGQTGAIPMAQPGDDPFDGPPRLIEVAPAGITVNGIPTSATDLATAIDALTAARSDPIVLRALPGTDLQRLVDVMEALQADGFTSLVLVE